METILNTRHHHSNYRQRQINESTILNFSSNDYLGLKNHPKIIESVKKAVDQYGVGSGSAYLLTGYTHAHQSLEEELADFLNYPRVLLFSSGYMANVGVISALAGKGDGIFADKLIHASLIDGCHLSKAKMYRYPHSNLQHLNILLEKSIEKNKMIISEGLYGMDGTITPLSELVALRKKHQCMLFLDDAHGIGVLGEQGRGCIEHFKVDSTDVTILVGTLGKAFSAYGAFVACNQIHCEYLIQFTRTYLFTTALPPMIAEAARMSLKIIREENHRREKLIYLINRFQQGAQQLNLTLMNNSKTPMQLIFIGDNKKAQMISQQLANFGIVIKPILPPTVPKNSARLRISFTASHTEENVDFLLEKLDYVYKKNI